MKKKILFIMESLGIGGAEKSLVTILSMLNPEEYDIDLFLFRGNGEFMPLVPEWVNILPLDEDAEIFKENFKTAWINYLLKADFKRSYNSLMWLIGCVYTKVIKKKEYVGWKWIKKIYNKLSTKYDTAVGFLEKKTIYFCVDLVQANKKIGFIHTNYEKIENDVAMDKKYFENINNILAVSLNSKSVLERVFPEYKDKIGYIKNMVSPIIIKEMANEEVDLYKDKKDTYVCTVGRLVEAKGIDIAVDICNDLIKKGYNIKWGVCGDGDDRVKLEKKIKEYNLEDNFILLGSQTNPYKYMNLCDIYVQPSRYEGYGITVAEAKVLCKPIIASDIPEFREQLINDETGILCKTKDDFVKEIEHLINNEKFKKQMQKNLKKTRCDMEELKKLKEIL